MCLAILHLMYRHAESHRSHHVGWLRAAVLGANDGIISTASLMIGVAATQTSAVTILLTGVAGLIAGAMAMAAGEYVSVSSQADTETADLTRERLELEHDQASELNELTQIYIKRGLSAELARQVAIQLTQHNALEAHARDELGITSDTRARPLQAATASALAFSLGAALPLLTAYLSKHHVILNVSSMSLLFLAALGALAAKTGAAPVLKGILRVTFWGALAMLITAGAGYGFGVVA